MKLMTINNALLWNEIRLKNRIRSLNWLHFNN